MQMSSTDAENALKYLQINGMGDVEEIKTSIATALKL